jgi:ethanolaminephosphotransferase
LKAQSANTVGLIRDSHGIDSLNCTLASLLETAALGYGSTKIGAFTALIPVLPMFFSTWETYHTHTLYLGYFNGPTGELIRAQSEEQV